MVPPISVVVPTRDRPGQLDRCLAALRAELRQDDEVVVADSASARADEIREIVRRHGGQYVRCTEPGAARARNAGWRVSRHELVGFVDDDVIVAHGWRAGIDGTFPPHADVQFATGRVEAPPEQLHQGSPVALVLHDASFPIDIDTVGPIGGSGNLIVRRSALEEVQGFDELLGAGTRLHSSEDHDLFDRLLATGRRGRHDPAIVAHHEQWRGKRATALLAWSYGVGGGARLAKLIRTDRARARLAAQDFVWAWGLAELGRDLRRGYKLGIVCDLMRLAGMAWGFVLALFIPVRGGHFARAR